MIGIVIVSHSFGIGKEVVKFCEELKHIEFPMISASGLDEETFGTSPMNIMDAINRADCDNDGVIILCDLGSSVMSSEMAIDLLEEEHRVIVADAPLIEGAIVAASANSENITLNELYQEILEAKTTSKLD